MFYQQPYFPFTATNLNSQRVPMLSNGPLYPDATNFPYSTSSPAITASTARLYPLKLSAVQMFDFWTTVRSMKLVLDGVWADVSDDGLVSGISTPLGISGVITREIVPTNSLYKYRYTKTSGSPFIFDLNFAKTFITTTSRLNPIWCLYLDFYAIGPANSGTLAASTSSIDDNYLNLEGVSSWPLLPLEVFEDNLSAIPIGGVSIFNSKWLVLESLKDIRVTQSTYPLQAGSLVTLNWPVAQSGAAYANEREAFKNVEEVVFESMQTTAEFTIAKSEGSSVDDLLYITVPQGAKSGDILLKTPTDIITINVRVS